MSEIHTVEIEGRQYGLQKDGPQLTLLVDGVVLSQIYVAPLEPEPEPIFVEPEPVAEGEE